MIVPCRLSAVLQRTAGEMISVRAALHEANRGAVNGMMMVEDDEILLRVSEAVQAREVCAK